MSELFVFQGEMLYQRRDDEEWIVLTKNLNTIRAIFGRDSDHPAGGEVDPEVGLHPDMRIVRPRGRFASGYENS